eukprot:10393975-Lingulodinium_polyedra.AAC.1
MRGQCSPGAHPAALATHGLAAGSHRPARREAPPSHPRHSAVAPRARAQQPAGHPCDLRQSR